MLPPLVVPLSVRVRVRVLASPLAPEPTVPDVLEPTLPLVADLLATLVLLRPVIVEPVVRAPL